MRIPAVVRVHRDVVVAVTLTVAAQAEIWLLREPDPAELAATIPFSRHAIAALGAAVFTLSLALGRRWPLVPLGLAIPAVATALAVPVDASIALAAGLVLATFGAGAWVTSASASVAGGAGVVTMVAGVALWHPEAVTEPGDLTLVLIALAGPWLAGVAMRVRWRRERDLEVRAETLERERDASAAEAIAVERARIARELHDVVAHALSIVVLQARGARRSLESDPGEAIRALDEIDSTGTQALAEMRRLVGVLRPEDEPGALSPRPGLRQLDALAEQIRLSGLPVEVLVEGAAVELPAGIDLAAYRVIQEALTNALRHAGPTAARVVVRFLSDRLELEITDGGGGETTKPSGGAEWQHGHGLIGMRERTALYGGTLEAGPRPGGGFAVRVRLPLATRTS